MYLFILLYLKNIVNQIRWIPLLRMRIYNILNWLFSKRLIPPIVNFDSLAGWYVLVQVTNAIRVWAGVQEIFCSHLSK